MANVPSNFSAAVVSGSASITGSFSGFTTLTAGTFTGLRDGNGGALFSNPVAFAAGVTVPLTVTSASISSGVVLLYP